MNAAEAHDSGIAAPRQEPDVGNAVLRVAMVAALVLFVLHVGDALGSNDAFGRRAVYPPRLSASEPADFDHVVLTLGVDDGATAYQLDLDRMPGAAAVELSISTDRPVTIQGLGGEVPAPEPAFTRTEDGADFVFPASAAVQHWRIRWSGRRVDVRTGWGRRAVALAIASDPSADSLYRDMSIRYWVRIRGFRVESVSPQAAMQEDREITWRTAGFEPTDEVSLVVRMTSDGTRRAVDLLEMLASIVLGAGVVDLVRSSQRRGWTAAAGAALLIGIPLAVSLLVTESLAGWGHVQRLGTPISTLCIGMSLVAPLAWAYAARMFPASRVWLVLNAATAIGLLVAVSRVVVVDRQSAALLLGPLLVWWHGLSTAAHRVWFRRARSGRYTRIVAVGVLVAAAWLLWQVAVRAAHGPWYRAEEHDFPSPLLWTGFTVPVAIGLLVGPDAVPARWRVTRRSAPASRAG